MASVPTGAQAGAELRAAERLAHVEGVAEAVEGAAVVGGEAFARGETFSGVNFRAGLEAVEELRPLVPPGATMAQLALRWILMFDAVSCVIPGAKRPSQAEDNVRASELPPLSEETMAQVRTIYDTYIRTMVHQRW